MDRITVTIATARGLLGLGTTKLYELINAGDLDTIRVGRRRLVTTASINRFIADRMAA